MKKLLATAAATVMVGGLAAGPAVAGPGNGKGKGPDPNKDRSPALKLSADMVKLGNVATFQCVAEVENATAREVVVDTCQAFRNGQLVAQPAGGRNAGNRATSERWTGAMNGAGDVIVCVSAYTQLTTGAVLGHFACV